MRWILLAVAFIALPAFPQATETFDAVSVRPSRSGTPFRSDLDSGHFIANGHSLMLLLMSAYPDIEIAPWKLAGAPSWLLDEFWDISAKLPPGVPSEQKELYHRTELMLQAMLAERFNLKVHREIREQLVYELVAAKNGVKLKPSESERAPLALSPTGGIVFKHSSIQGLIAYLRSPRAAVDRPVVNKTDLEGYFDFTLEWKSDSDPAGEPGPSIFTAIEDQLGLKLQPAKIMADFLVIDHVEKPTEN